MIDVLKIKLHDSNLADAVQTIDSKCGRSARLNLCVSATGAHGIITARKDKNFRDILNSFYMNLPDGMSSVWIGRIKGAKKMDRCCGPDFFTETIIATKDKDIKHFFCGGKNGVAEELKRVCEEKYGNRNIVGAYSPPFRELTDDEMKELGDEINSLNTNIVWIGLSTPKQEVFAYRLAKHTNVNFICTVGAAFDFHTGKAKRAPKWIQRIGMEWFFRLLTGPKRLWKRYFEVVPLFIWYNLVELIKGEFFTNNNLKEHS